MNGQSGEWINIPVMTWAMERAPIPVDVKIDKNGRKTVAVNRSCQLVLWALASRAADDYGRHCFPTIGWLADRTMLGPKVVRAALGRLVKDGVIAPGDETYERYAKWHGGHRGAIYNCQMGLTRESRLLSDPTYVEFLDSLREGGQDAALDSLPEGGQDDSLPSLPEPPALPPGASCPPSRSLLPSLPEGVKEVEDVENVEEDATDPVPGPPLPSLPSDPIDQEIDQEIDRAVAIEQQRQDEAVQRGDDPPDRQIQQWYFRLGRVLRRGDRDEKFAAIQEWIDAGRDPS